VIDLMLKGASEEPACSEGVGFALEIEVVHLNAKATSDVAAETWKAEASFVGLLAFAGQSKNGVTEKERHMEAPIDGFACEFHGGRAFGNFTQIDNCHLEGDADLRGSESDAFGFIHGGLEAAGELV
jgi:hypothetical protein